MKVKLTSVFKLIRIGRETGCENEIETEMDRVVVLLVVVIVVVIAVAAAVVAAVEVVVAAAVEVVVVVIAVAAVGLLASYVLPIT